LRRAALADEVKARAHRRVSLCRIGRRGFAANAVRATTPEP
jgi:hypothetical protein